MDPLAFAVKNLGVQIWLLKYFFFVKYEVVRPEYRVFYQSYEKEVRNEKSVIKKSKKGRNSK